MSEREILGKERNIPEKRERESISESAFEKTLNVFFECGDVVVVELEDG